jgi:hypothetical protein
MRALADHEQRRAGGTKREVSASSTKHWMAVIVDEPADAVVIRKKHLSPHYSPA